MALAFTASARTAAAIRITTASVAALTHKLGAREEREVRSCHDLCVRTALSMVTSDEGCLSAVSKGLRDSSLWFSKTFMV